MRRAILSAVIVLAITVSVALTATLGSGDASRPRPADHVAAGAPAPDPVAELPQVEAVAAYLHDLEAQRVGEYLVAVAHDELVAYLASLPTPTPTPTPTPAPPAEISRGATPPVPYNSGGGATGACGGATNGADQYIARESGGDPNVYNTGGSGAWGCYQLMPMHFAPGGTCSDMAYGQATPAQQAECASRLPLDAWALG